MTALQPTHGSIADVIVNGIVVSQYFSDFTLSSTRDKAEVSAFKNTFKAYVAGLNDGVATFSGWHDPNIDAVLYAYMVQLTQVDNDWLWAPEGAEGSTAQGNQAFSLSGKSTKYEVKSAVNAANSISAEVQLSQTGGGIDHGYILSPWATQSAGGSSASYDNVGGSTTKGGVLIVHAFSDAASLDIQLQDSADNSTFANVTGYTVSPTNSVAGEYRYPAVGTVPSGTIRQYTRITWTGTGTFLAMFSRK